MTLVEGTLRFARNLGIERFLAFLSPYGARPWFPAVAVLLAFAATLSMTIPVVPVVVSLVTINRSRWRTLALGSAIGSALAGALIAQVIEAIGMPYVHEAFPQLTQARHWHLWVDWTAKYGAWVLVGVAASPLAQTPVLGLAAMLGMNPVVVGAALMAGKVPKYGFTAYATARAADELISRARTAQPAGRVATPRGDVDVDQPTRQPARLE